MRYCVLEVIGRGEVVKINTMIDDVNWDKGKEEVEWVGNGEAARGIYYMLKREGFQHNIETGVLEGLFYGVVEDMVAFAQMSTFHRYIKMWGGLHNPLLLYSSPFGLPERSKLNVKKGVDGLSQLVKRYYRLKFSPPQS